MAVAVGVGVGAGDAVGADDDVPAGDADALTPGEAEDVGATLALGSGAFPTVAPPLHAASNSAVKITDELRINMKNPLRRTCEQTTWLRVRMFRRRSPATPA